MGLQQCIFVFAGLLQSWFSGYWPELGCVGCSWAPTGFDKIVLFSAICAIFSSVYFDL